MKTGSLLQHSFFGNVIDSGIETGSFLTSAIFHPRKPSLARGNLLVLVSVLLTVWLSDFPHNRATPLLLFPAACVVLGTIDTARCLRPKWDFYHGGIILCLYMDLMAATLVFFSLLYPYVISISAAS